MSEQPWAWKVPESSETIKRTMSRQDAHDKASGQAAYTRDIYLPGMLYAKILTSPYGHARIAGMDTSEAEALVGVRDILKFSDPDIAKDSGVGQDLSSYSILTLPGTADFYQHPMGVVVVADSEEICDRALKRIRIQWEELPFILDMEAAARMDAPEIMPEVQRIMGFFPGGGSSGSKGPNVLVTEDRNIGDVDKGFAEADKIIEYAIHRETNSPAGVEAMACVAGMMSFVSYTYACLMLQNGKVTIIGTRCDMGMDTESGYRHCVAAELGMKYDDVFVQERTSDNSAYSLAQPSGSSGTVNALPQLIQAAREMKQKILELAAGNNAMPMPFMFGSSSNGGTSVKRKPEDFDIKDSMIVEKARPEKKRSLSDITGGFMSQNPIIVHPQVNSPITMMTSGMMNGKNYVMGRQAHFIEAEVDVETGMV